MDLKKALYIAGKYIALFEPYCDRLQVAGSVRRLKPVVKDIEIVCIPKNISMPGLFNVMSMSRPPEFIRLINSIPGVKGKATGKYTQRILPEGIALDLFMVEHGNWGNQLAIRTGPAEYSHRVLGKAWVRAGYKSKDGFLTIAGRRVEAREEIDFYNLIGIPWKEPWNRIA